MKICPRCKTEKQLTEFYSNKARFDKVDVYCISCKKILTKEFKEKNPNKVKEYRIRSYKNNYLRHKEYSNKWRAANPEKHKKYCMISAARNPEQGRKWRKANPHITRASWHRHKSRKLSAFPKWADKDLIKDMQAEAVYFGLAIDHIVPLSNPIVCGLHWEGNLQLLSKSENSIKNNKFPYQGNDQPGF